jgi:hypothetical protein
MSFLQKLFGSGEESKSHQLPSSMVAKEFGEVNVRKLKDGHHEVMFTILLETAGEGWQTGLAIDGSGSMMDVFGKGLESGSKGDPPESLLRDYVQKGWLQFVQHQGQSVPILSDECKHDLVKRGYFTWSKNLVEPLARRMTGYLASKLDSDGGTTVIYWACGDGSQIEEIGDLTMDDCETASFVGPSNFGNSTKLTPAVRYFVDRFSDAPMGMYIFITDGELNDLPDVKKYTIQLCKEIAAGKRNMVKCVLIGMGESINEAQMEELDDLDSGTDVDIWDHKIAKEMRSLVEIFAELVSENQIVAPSGRIYDSSGKVIKEFRDGMPSKIKFILPAPADSFTLEIPDQPSIRQSIALQR